MLTQTELQMWIDALRANPKQQIKFRLVNEEQNGFCCLGKLCDVLRIPAQIDYVFIGEVGIEGELGVDNGTN